MMNIRILKLERQTDNFPIKRYIEEWWNIGIWALELQADDSSFKR